MVYPLVVRVYAILGTCYEKMVPIKVVSGRIGWGSSCIYSITDAVSGIIVVVVKGTVL
jgi:hypothetical protein